MLNLMRKNYKTEYFSIQYKEEEGEKHSFYADTKLQVDQIRRKIVAKFNKPLFFEKSNITTEDDHNFLSKETRYKKFGAA